MPTFLTFEDFEEDSYLPMFERLFLEIGTNFFLVVSNFLELPSFSVNLR